MRVGWQWPRPMASESGARPGLASGAGPTGACCCTFPIGGDGVVSAVLFGARAVCYLDDEVVDGRRELFAWGMLEQLSTGEKRGYPPEIGGYFSTWVRPVVEKVKNRGFPHHHQLHILLHPDPRNAPTHARNLHAHPPLIALAI